MIITQSLNRYTCKYVSLYINIKRTMFPPFYLIFILELVQVQLLLSSLLEVTYEPRFH